MACRRASRRSVGHSCVSRQRCQSAAAAALYAGAGAAAAPPLPRGAVLAPAARGAVLAAAAFSPARDYRTCQAVVAAAAPAPAAV